MAITYPVETFEQAVEAVIVGSNQLGNLVNGNGTTEITLADGSKVPSVRKAIVDNFYFKPPIAWEENENVTVFNQLYLFTSQGIRGLYYAPTATTSNPITMGTTPLGDSNFILYNAGFNEKPIPYSSGLTIDHYSQIFYEEKSGTFLSYVYVGDPLPYTTSGTEISLDSTGILSPNNTNGVWLKIGGSNTLYFNNISEATANHGYLPGQKLTIGGYNTNSDGGYSTFEVVNSSDPIGILTDDGNFKLKRMSGHDYFKTIVRSGVTPKIAAHRGWHGTTTGEFPGSGLSTPIYFVPENTRASIRFAAERGAWAIEGDTKISSDGVPVIFHDDTVDRVTNSVNTGNVSSFTYAQLKAMDVGTYVSAAWANERIMNYDEWLGTCKKNAVVPFAEWSYDMTSTQADDFLALVTKYYGPKPVDVYVQSTNMNTLALLRSKNAHISLCVMGTYGLALSTDTLNTAYKLGNCAAMLTGAAITNSTAVSDIKDRGLVLVYAIANTQARIDAAINAGADVIVTDFYRG